MTHDEYHNDTSRISKSGCDLVAQSPAHYYAQKLDPNREPRKETPAMFYGSLLHTAILEPNDLEKRYIQIPGTAPSRDCLRHRHAKAPAPATVQNIAWWDEFDGQRGARLLVPGDQYDDVRRISDSVYRHPAARRLLMRPAVVEGVRTWDDDFTGAPCKSRPDFDIEEDAIFVDLKSTEDASPAGFARSVASYRYDVQAAFYMDGAERMGCPYDAFIFIAVEKDPPFAVAVYSCPEDVMREGRIKYQHNLCEYMEALRTGKWPAYSDYIQDLEMPKYFFKYKSL